MAIDRPNMAALLPWCCRSNQLVDLGAAVSYIWKGLPMRAHLKLISAVAQHVDADSDNRDQIDLVSVRTAYDPSQVHNRLSWTNKLKFNAKPRK